MMIGIAFTFLRIIGGREARNRKGLLHARSTRKETNRIEQILSTLF